MVDEITGGLLLGPLALGHLLPSLSALIFPPSGLHPLEVVSNIGIVLFLFLFLIGTDLDLSTARQNRGGSLAISIGSIAAD